VLLDSEDRKVTSLPLVRLNETINKVLNSIANCKDKKILPKKKKKIGRDSLKKCTETILYYTINN